MSSGRSNRMARQQKPIQRKRKRPSLRKQNPPLRSRKKEIPESCLRRADLWPSLASRQMSSREPVRAGEFSRKTFRGAVNRKKRQRPLLRKLSSSPFRHRTRPKLRPLLPSQNQRWAPKAQADFGRNKLFP